MEFPCLNMNGTSRDALIQQYAGAVAALNIAIDMVQLTCPHGRDYPSPPCSFSEATKDYAVRVSALCTVRDGLQLIAEHIGSQGGGR